MINKISLNSAALAGVIATFPMSAVMLACKRWKGSSSSLIPPEQVIKGIIEEVEGEVDAFTKENLKNNQLLSPLSWSGHFAYGLISGSLYAYYQAVFPKNSSHLCVGASYGLLVWFESYCGWIPATKTLPGPSQTSSLDNTTRILSHIVWGSVLGKTYQILQSGKDENQE